MLDALKKGTLVGKKYLIDDYIGSGGMGTVYRATHVDLDRKVAIKVLKHFEDEDEKSISRFHREARAAGQIGHDNVCEVTDFGIDENRRAFIVMPLLSGCSFAVLLKRDAPLNGSRIIDICCQTLSALEAAHSNHIIHRDLKPDNIFITKVGDRDDFIKLLDFGISKYIHSDVATKLTRTGMVPGTPLYMAPEQAEGQKHLDKCTDLYSVGVILYEAFTGALPFKGDSYNEIVINIVTKPFMYPTSINPNIPTSVEKVILKAMSRDPALRYQDASEMREALEHLNSAEEIDAGFGGVERALDQSANTPTEDASSSSPDFPQRGADRSLEKQNRLNTKRFIFLFIFILALVNVVIILFGTIGYFLIGTE